MFKNYLKIAWRNLSRNRGFSITNILGLSIGMICTILILLWVQDELAYNKFHANYNNIYQVMAHRTFNNQTFTDQNMVLPLARTLQGSSPQIKNAVVTTHEQSHTLSYGDLKLKRRSYTVSDHFFDVFTWQFKEGSAANALPDIYSIVLTESTAKALFGKEEAIGKTLRMDNEYSVKVTAVVADVAANSSMQFDFIDAFNYENDHLKRNLSDWKNSSWSVYIQTTPGADMSQLDKQINAIKLQHDPSDKGISTYFSFPMEKWRLYSEFRDGKNIGGMIEYVRLFTIIAFIILLIACVNFMNLSTARSEKRAKEVGVRKTLGSDKRQLVLQFFFESVILSVAAFLVSIVAVYALLPLFNTLVDKQLELHLFQTDFLLAAVCIIAVTGLVAGSYPALYLSSFNPVAVLKGTFLAGKKAALPRRMLVVGQFVISIVLISATIIIYQQLQHIKNRDTGYNPNNLIMLPASPDVNKNFAVIKQELLKTGMITAVTRTLSPITEVWWKNPSPDWEGKPAGSTIIMAGNTTDLDFAKTMSIKMLAGKDFSGTPSDSTAMLLNKSAVAAMGLKNPVGMLMRFGKTYTVIGVTDDVVMESPFKAVDPMMIFFDPGNSNSVSIRLAPSVQPQTALRSIETIFKQYNPSVPFEYQFVDEVFGKKFIAENLINRITTIFSALAIFICCIGLAGLASFTIEKRVREIGIRKVLGASLQQVLMLISKEFLKLVGIAFLIAVPLAWWLMSNWLAKYAFHINISFWLFMVVGVCILALTLIVVSLNTIGAAVRNPVRSLRTE